MTNGLSTASASLLLLLLTATAQDCDLQCQQGAPCVSGSPDFSTHPVNADGTPAFSPGSLTHNGVNQHCSCPHGWTGILCDISFESCDGDHMCYNGGECVPGLLDQFGNEQLFCDCTDAVTDDGEQFVGKFCEHPANALCDENNPDHFCVNGGTCNNQYPQFGSMCECEEGYDGPHCEFKKGRVPDCSLDCGVGHCVLGIRDPHEMKYIGHLFEEDEGVMHCECPPGNSGSRCEISTSVCGEHECFHGGTCESKDKDGQTYHHCDCGTAHTETTFYAGRFCQYESTTLCFDDPENGKVFCVNEGSCPGEPYEACTCPEEFFGPSCEFPHDESTGQEGGDDVEVGRETQDCTMDCGIGNCVLGNRDPAAILGLEHLFVNEMEGMHCTCPPGHSGSNCEISTVACGEHECFFGGVCEEKEKEGETFHHCDCSTAQTDTAAFAGRFCEFESSFICSDNPGEGKVFCVNGGTCPTDPAETCSCSDEFFGPSCEFVHESAEQGGETPVCYLDCGVGNCVLGTRTPSDTQGLQHLFKNEVGGMYCNCPPGYSGSNCELSTSTCGEHQCFFDGVCQTKEEDGETLHHCDCSTAQTDTKAYAGRYCEFESTYICSDHPDEGKVFCVNGGTCPTDPSQPCTCPSDDFFGPSCEFVNDGVILETKDDDDVDDDDAIDVDDDGVDPETPAVGNEEDDVEDDDEMGEVIVDDEVGEEDDDMEEEEIDPEDDDDRPRNDDEEEEELEDDDIEEEEFVEAEDDDDIEEGGDGECRLVCENGGKCKTGAKHNDPALGFVEGSDQFMPHDTNFEHCVCQGDWVGLRCEHKVDRCPSGQHACLHGGKCVVIGDEESCNCSDASVDGVSNVAGIGCEHAATEICTTGELDPAQPRSFCVNEGTCKAKISPGQPHPGCNCVGEWMGPHCELKMPSSSVEEQAQKESDKKSGGEIAMIIFISAAVVLATVCAAYCLVRKYQRRAKELEEQVSLKANTTGYSDDPNLNAAPRYSDDPSCSGSVVSDFSYGAQPPPVEAV